MKIKPEMGLESRGIRVKARIGWLCSQANVWMGWKSLVKLKLFCHLKEECSVEMDVPGNVTRLWEEERSSQCW